ncbi:hypothetical protein [Tatumella sp. UCD-D_suzukii]|uniref:hypothetical protein n=1 Tax=Tatumella sp. UCD-D_suzukii TaxID=1408192 RepID=UPI00047117DB|nr:hypothetical protein [Tatumella sp. UCD-D_suzukii]
MDNEKIIRIGDFAQPVHRIMNENYIRSILINLQTAMEQKGWTFALTHRRYEIEPQKKAAFARAVYSAQTEFLRPYLNQESKSFSHQSDDAMSDGYAWQWLISIFDSLAELGIRPVPNDKSSERKAGIND